MKIKSLKPLIPVVSVWALAMPVVYSQTATGRFVGTIKDTSGAVIPNAEITVSDEQTAQERKITADATVYYVRPNLGPSTYKIRARGAGLGPSEVAGIPLPVGTERHVDIVVQ